MIQKSRNGLLSAVVGLGLVAVVLAALSSRGGPPTQGELRNTAHELEVQVRQFAAALALSESDYEPARGPNDLAARSEVVATGRIVTFRQGHSYADRPDLIWGGTAVMEVAVDRVLAGALPDESHRSLYFEFPTNNLTSAATLDAAAPKGARVLVYAIRMPRPSVGVIDVGSGLPEGQPLMDFTTPQGFLIDTGERIFVGLQGQPLSDSRLSLADLAPPHDRFPVDNRGI